MKGFRVGEEMEIRGSMVEFIKYLLMYKLVRYLILMPSIKIEK